MEQTDGNHAPRRVFQVARHGGVGPFCKEIHRRRRGLPCVGSWLMEDTEKGPTSILIGASALVSPAARWESTAARWLRSLIFISRHSPISQISDLGSSQNVLSRTRGS